MLHDVNWEQILSPDRLVQVFYNIINTITHNYEPKCTVTQPNNPKWFYSDVTKE